MMKNNMRKDYRLLVTCLEEKPFDKKTYIIFRYTDSSSGSDTRACFNLLCDNHIGYSLRCCTFKNIYLLLIPLIINRENQKDFNVEKLSNN